MTKPSNFILKPWLAALSLGVTVGGWALLARQTMPQTSTMSAPVTSPPAAISQSVTVELPPVPTVEALRAYAATGTNVNLPPVPVVIEPAPRPQIIQAPAAPAPQTPPVANTSSSR